MTAVGESDRDELKAADACKELIKHCVWEVLSCSVILPVAPRRSILGEEEAIGVVVFKLSGRDEMIEHQNRRRENEVRR